MVYPHKWWSPVSYRSSTGQGKFAGQRPTFYHCATRDASNRGIFPFNRKIFTGDDFIGAEATDRQLESPPDTSAVTDADEPPKVTATAGK